MKCQQDGWYAGALLKSRALQHTPGDPRRSAVAYPPATEEQLRASEQALGFLLPPVLRVLYPQVANGGFGTGTGIRGAIGGFGSPGSAESPQIDTTTVGYYLRDRQRRMVDLDVYVGQWLPAPDEDSQPYLELPEGVWPRGLLRLCDLGCMQEACLDTDAGQVLLAAPSTPTGRHYLLARLAPGLENGLIQWLEA
jgi:hypothetical protein